jgi:Ca2+-dependent lipid-binding protein
MAEKQSESSNEIYHFHFCAKKLDDKDLFGKSDPYIDIQRQNLDGTWNSVYRTEVINNNLNPKWRPFEIKSSQLCNGDRNRKLRFRIYDYDNDGS